MVKNKPHAGITLHLGCGGNYRPGFINVDLFDLTVADMGAHAAFLPFKANSTRMIKAYHLLEHFNWVEVKYLLNEWFRVLKGGGEVIVEVPNLEYTIKQLTTQKDIQSQTSTLQWMYGVNEPGMRHKTGFTYRILRNFLISAGFVEIEKGTTESHLYEKGLHIICKKPLERGENGNSLVHQFRVKFSHLVFFGKIESLSILEKRYIEVIESLLGKKNYTNKNKLYLRAISRLTICNPSFTVLLLDILRDQSLISKKRYIQVSSLLEYLININFHQKSFTLWALRKKTPGKVSEEFQVFVKELETRIQSTIESYLDHEKAFSYVASLNSESIPFFDIYFILHKSIILLNRGLKLFNMGRYLDAKEDLLESTKLNPDNYLTFWNLGRLGILTDDPEVTNFYQLALNLAQSNTDKQEIQHEVHTIKEPYQRFQIRKPVWKSQG